MTPDNPLAGRNAFVSVSHGYVSTRYNLSSLAGQALRIRFRNTSDSSVASGRAWIVDEVRIYTCATDPSPNAAPRASAGADQTSSPLTVVTLDGSGSEDSDGYLAEAQWTLVSGPQLALNRVGRSLSFAAPIVATQDTFLFRLTVTDNRGAVASDEATVTVVNRQPVVVAGPDQTLRSRSIVNLSGQATDGDGTIASYRWTQVSGPSVTLSDDATTAASFTAPSVAVNEVLTLRLTARRQLRRFWRR